MQLEAFRTRWINADETTRATMTCALNGRPVTVEDRDDGPELFVDGKTIRRSRDAEALGEATVWFVPLDAETCAALGGSESAAPRELECAVAGREKFVATVDTNAMTLRDAAGRTFRLHRSPTATLKLRRVKDQLNGGQPTPSGYRSLLINYEFDNCIAEIQLMPASFYRIKERTHVLYSVVREVEAKNVRISYQRAESSGKMLSKVAPLMGNSVSNFNLGWKGNRHAGRRSF